MKTKLTQARFFELLAERAKKHPFIINKHGWIREKRSQHCPATAVARQLGYRVDACDEMVAAQKTGFPNDFICAVAHAADAILLPHVRLRRLRSKLIKVLGL